jgi:hypothetical protein
LASKEDQTIYCEESVPKGFILSDPDHLQGTQIESLYSHWLGRQKKKLRPFIILNASPQHQFSVRKSAKAKGKKRQIDYVPVSTSGEEDSSGDDESNLDEEDREEGQISPPIKVGPPNRKSAKNISERNEGSSKAPPTPIKIGPPNPKSTKNIGEQNEGSSKAPPTPKKSQKMKQKVPVSPARQATPGPSKPRRPEISNLAEAGPSSIQVHISSYEIFIANAVSAECEAERPEGGERS